MWMRKRPMNDTVTQPVSRTTLFLIGVSAGVIAACFPRLLPFLSQAEQAISIELFTTKFIMVAAAFSAMIGVSMIWLYMGSREHTKNLFMSALALPAVLSGGINMSSFTSVAENRLQTLNNETFRLQEALGRKSNIGIVPLDLGAGTPLSSNFIPGMLGISTAHAQESGSGGLMAQTSVEINVDSLDKKFMILLDTSEDKQTIQQQRQTLQNVPDLKTITIGGKYYLLQNQKKTRSEALLDAIELQERYGLNPQLVPTE